MPILRKATISHLPHILKLLQTVSLPREGVTEQRENFFVLEEGGELLGNVGYELHGEVSLLRSLAVRPSHEGRGYGSLLAHAALDEMRNKGVREVYLLTETARDFFLRFGFVLIDRHEADRRVKASAEFEGLCPSSAACMKLTLMKPF